MEEAKKDFDVQVLREYYNDAMEYLDAKAKLDSFNAKFENEVDNYEKNLKVELGFFELEKQYSELENKVDEYENLKVNFDDDNVYGIDEDDVNTENIGKTKSEYEYFTEEQLEDYFDKSKQCELLKRKIKKEEEKINEKVAEYRESKEKLKSDHIKSLKQNVIKKGYKLIDVDKMENVDKKLKFNINKIEEMLVNNEYNDPYVQHIKDKKDYSANKLYWNLKARNYIGDLSSEIYNKFQYFDYKRLSKNYSSTMEYFISQLEKQTGRKYEKVSIVTNQTDTWSDHYKPDQYVVYGATLILPVCLAGTLKMTEKKFTTEKLHEFLERHKEVILLEDRNVAYYIDNYSLYGNWNDNYKNNKKNSKFNETYRKEVRRELSSSIDSNSIDLEKLFNLKEKDLDFGLDGEKIVGNLPCKEIANAAFDTLEYAKKLVRLAELEKVVNKRKKQQEAEEEYEELKKNM